MSDEVGRELKASELKAGEIVVIEPPGHSAMITMWVGEVREDTVVFYSGVKNWHVMNFVRDDAVYDDQGRWVHVYEYLGET